ncbi:MAG: 30S ribosomal protein S6 [Deltaproteobacteria bacterium]|nr:30S ribosomal protein S6 [Deltaproteobacteria bacterium]
MRRYESVVILDPELSDDEVRTFTERYSGIIKKQGGELIKLDDWGRKKMAYLVKKRDVGRYVLFDFVGLPEVITEVERNFKITESVLKFISVKLDHNVNLEAFKAQRETEAAAAAPAEAPSGEAAETKAEPKAEQETAGAEKEGEPV